MASFNDRIRQILILGLLLLMIFLAIKELKVFLPGLLGALTLYILSRASYFQLVFHRKWKRGRAALMYVFYYLLLLGLPIFLAVALIGPKVNAFLSDPEAMLDNLKHAVMQVQQKIGMSFVSETSIDNGLSKLSEFLPTILNSTANLITNLVIALFLLYYMLYHGREIEMNLFRYMPLKNENTMKLAHETKKMIKANALGIPMISIIQGITATLGYFLFGIKEFGLWGFLTGVFAFFPVVGTMVIWVPLVIYTFASGDTWNGTGLLIYSVVVTGNVDYIARITLLRKMGNVHPVVTVLGVLVGLGLFGFIGLIFGPLLVNYIIVVFNIYLNEFSEIPVEAVEFVDSATPKEGEEPKEKLGGPEKI
jgi:predicted PurR-regulated permease PerM